MDAATETAQAPWWARPPLQFDAEPIVTRVGSGAANVVYEVRGAQGAQSERRFALRVPRGDRNWHVLGLEAALGGRTPVLPCLGVLDGVEIRDEIERRSEPKGGHFAAVYPFATPLVTYLLEAAERESAAGIALRVLSALRDVSAAVRDLNGGGLYHNDLSAENVIVLGGRARLIDMDSCRRTPAPYMRDARCARLLAGEIVDMAVFSQPDLAGLPAELAATLKLARAVHCDPAEWAEHLDAELERRGAPLAAPPWGADSADWGGGLVERGGLVDRGGAVDRGGLARLADAVALDAAPGPDGEPLSPGVVYLLLQNYLEQRAISPMQAPWCRRAYIRVAGRLMPACAAAAPAPGEPDAAPEKPPAE